MAIARDTSTTGGKLTGAPSSASWSHTCGTLTNGVLIVSINMHGGSTPGVSAISYNGVAMTQIGSTYNPVSYERLMHYRLVNPASGAHTISITFSGTTDEVYPYASSYSGVDQTTPIDPGGLLNNYSASGTSITGTATLTNANCWLVGIGGGQSTVSGGTNFTQLQSAFSQSMSADSNASVGSGSRSITMNMSPSNEIFISGFALNPAVAVTLTETQLNRYPIRGESRGIMRRSLPNVRGLNAEKMRFEKPRSAFLARKSRVLVNT